MVTATLRSTVIILLLAIISQPGATESGSVAVARETEAKSAACGSYCLRSSSIGLYQTPPYLTAKVSVAGTSLLGRMRGCVVSGEFTKPDNQKVQGFGWVGTRNAMIRMPIPTDGAPPGTYTFRVINIAMRGNMMYRFDPLGSKVLTAMITIP